MKTVSRTWVRGVVSSAGSIIAGPAGVLVGSLLGGVIDSALPGIGGLGSNLVASVTAQSIKAAGEKWGRTLPEEEKKRVNHDLQNAFRDAFREALLDIGGQACYPKLVVDGERDVPEGVKFPETHTGKVLWQKNHPLAIQVEGLMADLLRALEEGDVLPLDPPAGKKAADVQRYLKARTPGNLADEFFTQNLTQIIKKHKSLLDELPELETHLRRHLFERTVVHLGEALKHRTPAWRAFNRLVLEALQDEVGRLSAGQSDILEKLDVLLGGRQPDAFTAWSDGMASLLSATGGFEREIGEGFEELGARVVDQHRETLERFDRLMLASERIEAKVERVLTFLENGTYKVIGDASRTLHSPPAAGEAPYKGLEYFDEDDAGLFYGREQLIGRLAARLERARFLAIVGASGSGKSSIVRAGLVPLLRKGTSRKKSPAVNHWSIYVMTPTSRPFEALAACLTGSQSDLATRKKYEAEMRSTAESLTLFAQHQGIGKEGRMLLVVDQFEELFTLCEDEEDREKFITLLMNATQGDPSGACTVIIILRADFYAGCADYESLRVAVSENQEFIGPMSTEELERAIQCPAELNGWKYEPGLIRLMISDTGNDPGALPLLSHALLETWKHRSGRTMTLESYGESGGVKGAIAKTAEEIFTQRLSKDQQHLARSLFLRLTNLNEAGLETRRRVSLEELVSHSLRPKDVQRVLNILVEARLVTLSTDYAELTHEALIREWPRLQAWLDDNRASLITHRRLTETVHEWQMMGEDDDLLYRGVRLAEIQEWCARYEITLNDPEQKFIQKSISRQQKELEEKEARQKRDLLAARQLAESEKKRAEEQTRMAGQLRRRAIILRVALGVVGVLTVVAITLAMLANDASQTAIGNAGTAQAASTMAVAQQATAQAESTRAAREAALARASLLTAQAQTALIEGFPQRSLLLAAEAYKISMDYADPHLLLVQNSLYQGLTTTGGVVIGRDTAPITSAAFSPDGRYLAIAGGNKTQLLDLTSPNPAGTALVLREAGADFMVYTWLGFSSNNRWLVESDLTTTYLWDLSQPDPATSMRAIAMSSQMVMAMLSPDGRWLATGSEGLDILIWDLGDDDPALAPIVLHVPEGFEAYRTSYAISPDNQWLVATHYDAGGLIWNLNTPDAEPFVLSLPSGETSMSGAAFSPDGKWLFASGSGNDGYLWETESGGFSNPPLKLAGHNGAITSVAFSSDGNLMATGSVDDSIRVWNLKSSDPSSSSMLFLGHGGDITGLIFNPEANLLASTSSDHTGRVWNLLTTDPSLQPLVLQGHDDVIWGLALGQDGKTLATVGGDGMVREWDITTVSAALVPFSIHPNNGFIGMVHDPNDGWLWTVNRDNTLVQWGLDGMPPVETGLSIETQSGIMRSLKISPDGRWIACGFEDGTVRLNDLESLNQPVGGWVLEFHSAAVETMAFSTDLQWLATGDNNGTVAIWNLTAADPGDSPLTFTINNTGVNYLGFAGSRWLVVNGFVDNRIRLLDLESNDPPGTARIFENCIPPVAVSPNGERVAANCGDGVLIRPVLIDVTDPSAEPAWLMNFPQMLVARLVFSPDSRWLAATGYDGTVYLQDLQAAPLESHAPFQLTGHVDVVGAVAFSADNRWLATGGNDRLIQLYDLSLDDPTVSIGVMRGHTGGISSLRFSRDGEWLISSSIVDETVRIWPLDPQRMLDLACIEAGRNLSLQEWNQFFFTEAYRETCK